LAKILPTHRRWSRAIWLVVCIISLSGIAACGRQLQPIPASTEASAVASLSDLPKYVESADLAQLGQVAGYGRGAAFSDVDGDGWDDLFVTDTDSRFRGETPGISLLYINQRDGTFRPTDAGFAEADLLGTWVASFADYDNDGDPDVMLGNGGYTVGSSLVLYENRMSTFGRFVNVTDASGVAASDPAATASGWWGVAWADYDGDGWLDVVATRTMTTAPGYNRPLLFRNNGDGTFEELAVAVGVLGADALDAKNPVWLDYDADGDQDLYLAGVDAHAFYENVGGGTFQDVTSSIFDLRLETEAEELWPGVFSAAAADFDQDGRVDLYLGRWDFQDYVLFNDGDGSFTAHGAEAGLDAGQRLVDREGDYENTMGLGVGDLYDDGLPDVVVGSGTPELAGPDIVYCNRGGRQFARCTDAFVEADDSHRETRGHAPIFADVDQDGRTDLFWNLGGHPDVDEKSGSDSREVNKFFRLSVTESADTATLRLEGTSSNRDAIGAKVTVRGSDTRHYWVRSTQGFQGQNSQALILSLGDVDSAPVRVDWPSGNVSTLTVRRGERIRLVE
jgi:hypothetical protein